MASLMGDNGSTQEALQKTVSKHRRSWIVVCAFLCFTFFIILGYTLLHRFSWANQHPEYSLSGVQNDDSQPSPTQPSIPASLATVHDQLDVKIESLLPQLTLDKIAKLTYAVPGVVNPGLPELGIKRFKWDLSCYHGNRFSTNFPVSLALAATFSSELNRDVASIIGSEARFNWESTPRNESYSLFGKICFAPNVNLMRDPRWSGNLDTFGEDPLVISSLTKSYISGLHGNNPVRPRIMTGCRYLSVFSGPEDTKDPVNFDARVSLADLYMSYLKPYQACVEAGSLAIMCSYHRFNGIPSCAVYNQLSVELRHNWHYKGIVISDVDAVRYMMTSQKYRLTSQDTASSCIAAGCNMELTSFMPGIYASQKISLANGTIKESEIIENVKPILRTSLLMDQTVHKMPLKPTTEEVKQLEIKALMKSFVLLKNDGLLPLQQKYRKLAIIGLAGADILSNGTFLHSLEGLAQTMVYFEKNMKMIINAVKDSDLVIITLSSKMNFSTKSDYEEGSSDVDTLMLKEVVQSVKKNTSIIMLLLMASPVDISWASQDPKVSAILECFQPVKETGVAIYNTLVNYQGQSSPGGRLPFTWPASFKDFPKPTDYRMKNRTYRYSTGVPLYPFGYGLSYSKFEYSDLETPPQILSYSPLPLSFTLKNHGPYDADEVLQVYIKWPHTHVRNVPRIQLVHFERVSLESGQSRKFTFTIPYENFAIWTGQKQGYTTIPGVMTLSVGGQQPDQRMSSSTNVLSKNIEVIMMRNPQEQQLGQF